MTENKDNIILSPLEKDDYEQFIKDNQRSFKYGALEEFGMRDNHLNKEGEIISRRTIEKSIKNKNSETYRIILNGKKVGGVIIKINKEKKFGELEIIYINPEEHSKKGIGFKTWNIIEKMHPEIDVWEAFTPYFEKRNIHFYVNKCRFHIVEFCHNFHRLQGNEDKEENEDNEDYEDNEDNENNEDNDEDDEDDDGPDEMFRFQKIIRKKE